MYLTLVLALCLLVFVLDLLWHTRLAGNPKFWAMQLFAAVMVVSFDIYAVGRIWFFNSAATVGITIVHSPLENLLFGFAMIGLTLVCYEKSLRH